MDASNLDALIAEAAVSEHCDYETIDRLIALRRHMMDHEAERAFNEALSQVQGAVRAVHPDRHNPQTRSEYASYTALDRAVRPHYVAAGLSVSYDTAPTDDPDMIQVIAYVSHVGGHTRTYSVRVPTDGRGIKGTQMMTRTHAMGSGMSYGMRYLLKMIFNLSIGDEDDDGNASGGTVPPEPVTDDQADTIESMLSEHEMDQGLFLRAVERRYNTQPLTRIADIPAVIYEDCVQYIQMVAERKARQGGKS